MAAASLMVLLKVFSSQTVTTIQWILACNLLFLTVRAYLSWVQSRKTKIPAWPLICALHFVFYGAAIFNATRGSPSVYDRGAMLDDSTLTLAMLVGTLGLLSMWTGRRVAARFTPASNIRLNLVDISAYTPVRIHLLLIIGITVNLFGLPFYGTVLWNVSVVLFSTLPLAAFVWIVLKAAVQGMTQIDLLCASAFFLSRILSGAAFGASLGTIVIPALLTGLAAISVNRRLPWRTITAVLFLVLFLQPSKGFIRQQLSVGDLGRSPMGVLLTWIRTAAQGWSDVFSGEASLDTQFSAASSRASLLTLSGVILEKTPQTVPYQEGVNYTLLLKNLIPRFVWPEKPTANLSNQFFQVEYGLATKEDLSSVSMACGFEAEGFMNFGWPGVIAAAFFVGFVFGCYESVFFSPHASLATTALGLSLLPGFMTIESQLVVYLGGIVQVLFAAGIAFWNPKARLAWLHWAPTDDAQNLPSFSSQASAATSLSR
jgi:hypothetical protein